MDDLTEDELREKYGDPPFWDSKEMYMNSYPLVEIEWDDATICSQGTHILEEALAHSVSRGRTAGFLLKETDTEITVVMTHFYDTDLPLNECPAEGFRYLMVIPKGCVTKMVYK